MPKELTEIEWEIVRATWGIKGSHHVTRPILAAITDHIKTERAKLWDDGFSEGMRQWTLQRDDENHPITRTNPYKENN